MQRALVVTGTAMRMQLRGAPEIVEAAVAQHLDVTHHVRVADRHEAPGAEEFTHLDLVGERFLGGRALLAAQDRLLFVVEFHAMHHLIHYGCACTNGERLTSAGL